jgi:predicted RNA-binding protein with TRAM domain
LSENNRVLILKYVCVQIKKGLDILDDSWHDVKKNKERSTYLPNLGSFPESSLRYPVKIGDEYEVIILDMSRNGDSGVTRIKGLVTFVGGTKPDDKVKIKITKIGKGYARGQLISYLDL